MCRYLLHSLEVTTSWKMPAHSMLEPKRGLGKQRCEGANVGDGRLTPGSEMLLL